MEPYPTEHLEVESGETKSHSVWHTVTPFSKYAAMLLFIAMPFIGGYVGYHYAPEKVVEVERVVEIQVDNFEKNVLDLDESRPEVNISILDDGQRRASFDNQMFVTQLTYKDSFILEYILDDEFARIWLSNLGWQSPLTETSGQEIETLFGVTAVTGDSCYMELCLYQSNKTFVLDGVEWEYLGLQNYCAVGGCSHYIYRSMFGDYVVYVDSVVPLDVFGSEHLVGQYDMSLKVDNEDVFSLSEQFSEFLVSVSVE